MLLLLLLLLLSTCQLSSASAQQKRPNFVIVLTDDQDSLLGSLQAMPRLRVGLADAGMRLSRAFSTTPICCPSRSSLLTGRYSHNHGAVTNRDGCCTREWRLRHETVTFGKQLQEAGYATAYFGKYLNQYDGTYVPVGWSRWYGQVRNSRFYNFTVRDDSRLRRHGFAYSTDYFTDLVTNKSLEFLDSWRSEQHDSPFLLLLSFPAPHGPEDSAPQYQNLFLNNTSHRTSSYNVAPNPDKEWLLRSTQPMDNVAAQFTDLLHAKRLQTLQSVDVGVDRLLSRLRHHGVLDDTFVFYTSDHGYHLGQFGLLKGKSTPYEFDIRVPLLVRGPGVRAGSSCHLPVLNIDLAPTLLDLAGVTSSSGEMDGVSYAPLLLGRTTQWRQAFLVERGRMTSRLMQRMQVQEEARNFKRPAAALCQPAERRIVFSCRLGDDFRCRRSSSDPLTFEKVRCPRRCDCKNWLLVEDSFGERLLCRLRPQRQPLCNSKGLRPFINFYRRLGANAVELANLRKRLRIRLASARQDSRQLLRVSTCSCSAGPRLRFMALPAGLFTVGVVGADPLRRLPDDRPVNRRRRKRRGRWRRRRRRHGKAARFMKSRRRRNRGSCHKKYMSCFFHDKSHWRTPPLWTGPSICFCGNARNHTYACTRIINATADALFCEFATGFLAYYDMRADPNQLVNRVFYLTFEQRAQLLATLKKLRRCNGSADCNKAEMHLAT